MGARRAAPGGRSGHGVSARGPGRQIRSPAARRAAPGGGSGQHGGAGATRSGGGCVMGSVGFLFFIYFYLIYRGGQKTASVNVSLTVTVCPRRLACPPRKSDFDRLRKGFL